MLKSCVKHVERLWKAAGKTAGLCTESTTTFLIELGLVSLCPADFTVFAQKNSPFTQHFQRIFTLLSVGLYPVSTIPMNTTNLIKE